MVAQSYVVQNTNSAVAKAIELVFTKKPALDLSQCQCDPFPIITQPSQVKLHFASQDPAILVPPSGTPAMDKAIFTVAQVNTAYAFSTYWILRDGTQCPVRATPGMTASPAPGRGKARELSVAWSFAPCPGPEGSTPSLLRGLRFYFVESQADEPLDTLLQNLARGGEPTVRTWSRVAPAPFAGALDERFDPEAGEITVGLGTYFSVVTRYLATPGVKKVYAIVAGADIPPGKEAGAAPLGFAIAESFAVPS